MAKTINGTVFTNLNNLGKGAASYGLKFPGIENENDLQEYIEAGENYQNIQSVLIDWNGAQVDENRYINTTGELIAWIKENIINDTQKQMLNSISGFMNLIKGYFNNIDYCNKPLQGNYYWYVGQANPLSMNNISPIVNDTISPGWRYIGLTLPEYNESNKLFDGDNNTIITGNILQKQYVILPNECNAVIRDGFGNDATTVDIYRIWDDILILNDMEYKVYETVGKSKKLLLNIY